MAGKKNDIRALKTTTGGRRYEDCFNSKFRFDQFTVDDKNTSYIFYTLRSPLTGDVIKAVAGLEVFVEKSPENLKKLCSLGIFEFLFPLINHDDRVVKRFAQKLVGMLCSLEEFRERVLEEENILQTLVDSLAQEVDEVLQEFTTLILAELSKESHAATELLHIHNCIETLFTRIQSLDPDVQKNCLDIMIHILNGVDAIDFFVKSPLFNIKSILFLTSSSYSVIQSNALEVLKQLTAGSRDPTFLLAFRDAMGIETTLDVLENKDWEDLHDSATELLINAAENPELCDYILHSGNLGRLITLVDEVEDKTDSLKFIGILAKLTQTFRGCKALHLLEMDKRFTLYLDEENEKIQEYSCYAIANLAQYPPCLPNILENNPVDRLLEMVINDDSSDCTRNLAAYSLSILCHESKRASTILSNHEKFDILFFILTDTSNVSVDFCQNLIQIFIGISQNEKQRARLINREFLNILIGSLSEDYRIAKNYQSLQVDTLECLSRLLVDKQARSFFNELGGTFRLIECLRSKYSAVRDWAGHIVTIMAQNEEFANHFIRHKGLQWMLKQKNTMYTMPSWRSAIDAIFTRNLPAKFAYVGRLDFQDITKDGFFAFSNPSATFILLEDFFQAKFNPIFPVYFVNFSNESLFFPESKTTVFDSEDTETTSPIQKDWTAAKVQNVHKSITTNDGTENIDVLSILTEPPARNLLEEVEKVEDFFADTLDPYLSEYLNRLKKKIEKNEVLTFGDTDWWCMHPQLIIERAKIIAQFVANEMSGPNLDPACNAQYKISHINEMKFTLGTNIIPLGFIRMGDYFERALLFKALADRVGFPCALVRGPPGKFWIEIAIPIINVEEIVNNYIQQPSKSSSSISQSYPKNELERRTDCPSLNSTNDTSYWNDQEVFDFPKLRMDCFTAFPPNFLKPNAVVDLTNIPGRILPINSFEAKLYCGYAQP